MSKASCPQESAVARAVRGAGWNASLEMHVRECAACREVRDAARWMQALAAPLPAQSVQSGELPGARMLWMRAQIAGRHAAAERAQTIAEWVEIAFAAVVCISATVWLAWNWGAVGGAVSDALDWVTFDAWPAFWAGLYAYVPVTAPLLFSLALAVIAIITVGVAYPLLARE